MIDFLNRIFAFLNLIIWAIIIVIILTVVFYFIDRYFNNKDNHDGNAYNAY